MAELNKKIRRLKNTIRLDTEDLKKLEKENKKWNEMCVSINLGRGNYYKLIKWPNDLSDYMGTEDFKNKPDEEKQTLIEEFKKAVNLAKQVEDEYNRLTDTRDERDKKIKEFKKRIKVNKTNLAKIEKEKHSHFIKIKQLDKKVKPYIDQGETKKRVYKPEKDEK